MNQDSRPATKRAAVSAEEISGSTRSKTRCPQEHALKMISPKRIEVQTFRDKDLSNSTLLMSQRTNSSKYTVSSTSYNPSEINPLETIDSDISIPDNYLQLSLFHHIKSLLASKDVPRNKKIQILTLLPPQWTYQTIEDNFELNWRIVNISKIVLEERGILGTPDLRKGTCLKKYLVDLVDSKQQTLSRIQAKNYYFCI